MASRSLKGPERAATLRRMRLRITEIFFSIQGESSLVGRPSAFIRLTGCDLRCAWCDSTYTFTGGEWRSLESIFEQVCRPGVDLVCVTGGEPLLQKNVHPLMEGLLERGLEVSLETGGHRDISGVDPRVRRIVDLKAPGSGEVAKIRWENLEHLSELDELKFVLADRADYEWARDQIREHGLATRAGALLMSPVHGALALDELAAWILEDVLPVRLQLQLHKYLWGADARGV